MTEKQNLYNFIVNNHDLELLESRLNVFNPFEVLKIERYEIRHSNVLAWLLDPKENHGLGDFFLKKMVSQIALENEEVIDEAINLLDIHLGDFGDAIVKREEQDIDILLASERNQFLLLIENKIHARESKHQLTKYLNYARKQYASYKILPVLLTKAGDDPENNLHYGAFSHESVYRLIRETLRLKERNLAGDVVDFIQFYLQTLEKTLGMNDELKDLCLKIYNEHKDALDLIFETINQNETALRSAFEAFGEGRGQEMQIFSLRQSSLWFLPRKMMEVLPQKDLGWIVPYPITFWFARSGEDKVKFHIEIGPFADPNERLAFVNHLGERGYGIRPTAKRLESKYTRIHTKKLRVEDWTDQEGLLELLEKLYAGSRAEIERIYEAAGAFGFGRNG